MSRPTPQQAAWQEWELGMMICIGLETWQDREEDTTLDTPLEKINPDKLDTDQWVSAAEAIGAKYIIFVAKHEGGFCLWQTETTDYGVRNTPWRGGKGDMMKDLAESCRKRGIKLGVYLSPQDHYLGAGLGGRCKTPEAQQRYDKIYRQQLTELLSRYGEMFEVWFDGSCITDVGDLLKRYCPKAMVFQGPQATIRWVGNEDGIAPYPNWNSLPLARAQSGVSTGDDGTPDGDAWLPNECDARIRATWFWNSTNADTLKSVEQLMTMYYQSVGRGAVLLLNMGPDTTGLMPTGDVKRATEFGAEIRRRFTRSIAETSGKGKLVELDLGWTARIDHVITMENIAEGERVREYVIEGLVSGQWKELCRGSSIGYKKIDQFNPTEVSKVHVRVVKSVAEPQVRKLAVYAASGSLKGIAETGPANAAQKVWEWSAETVGKEWKTVDIDLIAVCKEACVYQVDFTAAEGKSPLEIQSLTLLQDGVPVPEFTKPVAQSLRYNLTITGLGRAMALRAVVRVSGGQKDSQGTLTIRKGQQ
jgi:alpha-L-fucosidase